MTRSPDPSRATARPTADAIVLRSVTKGFRSADGSRFTAVDGLDLRVGRGEVVAFLGPNGAGKSTTVDMILGLTEPDSGSVSVLGHDPLEASRLGLISAVMQSGGLLPSATVEDLIRVFGSIWSRTSSDEVIDRAGLSKLRKRHISKLSGGEQQRVRFALALLPDPEILVLDEPTAGMDVSARRDFWRAVREDAANGRTIIFATHYLEEADEFADRILMVRAGRLIADGNTAQIRASVSGRTVSAEVGAATRDFLAADRLVSETTVRGERTYFRATDSDTFLARLMATGDATRIEVSSTSLEEAFVQLTSDPAPREALR